MAQARLNASLFLLFNFKTVLLAGNGTVLKRRNPSLPTFKAMWTK